MKGSIRKMTCAAAALALCLVLPFLTGQIPEIGNKLSPMHVPVLLCGMLCGWGWGAVVGLIAPLLRFALFGMPPLMPTGLAMAAELATYGCIAGGMTAVLPKRNWALYASLLAAMIGGRLVWGAAQWILLGIGGGTFTLSVFWAGAVANALPGIVLHIVLIPPIVMALRRARFL